MGILPADLRRLTQIGGDVYCLDNHKSRDPPLSAIICAICGHSLALAGECVVPDILALALVLALRHNGAVFVSKNIKPCGDDFALERMLTGEPGLPRSFAWGDRTIVVAEVIKRWKSCSPCKHGSTEQYVRRHWYRILDPQGNRYTLYFDRSLPKHRRDRWWLYDYVESDA